MASKFSIREIYVGLFSTFLLDSIVHLTELTTYPAWTL